MEVPEPSRHSPQRMEEFFRYGHGPGRITPGRPELPVDYGIGAEAHNVAQVLDTEQPSSSSFQLKNFHQL